MTIKTALNQYLILPTNKNFSGKDIKQKFLWRKQYKNNMIVLFKHIFNIFCDKI